MSLFVFPCLLRWLSFPHQNATHSPRLRMTHAYNLPDISKMIPSLLPSHSSVPPPAEADDATGVKTPNISNAGK